MSGRGALEKSSVLKATLLAAFYKRTKRTKEEERGEKKKKVNLCLVLGQQEKPAENQMAFDSSGWHGQLDPSEGRGPGHRQCSMFGCL